MRSTNTASVVQRVCKSICCAFWLVTAVSMPAHAGGSSATVEQAAEIGSIWWSEIVSANPAKSREFYANVFGWTPKVVSAVDTSRAPALGEDEYTIYSKDGVEIAGSAMKIDAATDVAPPGWVNYIQVVNVDAAAENAVKLGGKIIKPPYDMAGTGRFALVKDPDGVVIGLVAPAAAHPNQ